MYIRGCGGTAFALEREAFSLAFGRLRNGRKKYACTAEYLVHAGSHMVLDVQARIFIL